MKENCKNRPLLKFTSKFEQRTDLYPKSECLFPCEREAEGRDEETLITLQIWEKEGSKVQRSQKKKSDFTEF